MSKLIQTKFAFSPLARMPRSPSNLVKLIENARKMNIDEARDYKQRELDRANARGQKQQLEIMHENHTLTRENQELVEKNARLQSQLDSAISQKTEYLSMLKMAWALIEYLLLDNDILDEYTKQLRCIMLKKRIQVPMVDAAKRLIEEKRSTEPGAIQLIRAFNDEKKMTSYILTSLRSKLKTVFVQSSDDTELTKEAIARLKGLFARMIMKANI